MWLAHHGVKGMKWGVRRYQNKDGSLTDLGKRINKAKRANSGDKSEIQKDFKAKKIGKITYEELNDDWRIELGKEWVNRFNQTMDPEWIKTKEGMVAVENGKKIAGYIIIGDYNKKKWITPVETFEEYRGNKIASNLIDKQLDKYGELNLGVYVDNPVAKRIYDAKGFETYDHKFYKDGTGVYYMKKKGKPKTLFISGSSKTQNEESPYYRKELPKEIKNEINTAIKAKKRIIVGDAPGIDRQVQDYLKNKGYSNVEVFGPGKKVRYSADSKWKTNPIDSGKYKPDTDKWRAEKDIEMSKIADEGLAIVLENGGAGATRDNVRRLSKQMKDVKVYELSTKEDKWIKEV